MIESFNFISWLHYCLLCFSPLLLFFLCFGSALHHATSKFFFSTVKKPQTFLYGKLEIYFLGCTRLFVVCIDFLDVLTIVDLLSSVWLEAGDFLITIRNVLLLSHFQENACTTTLVNIFTWQMEADVNNKNKAQNYL